MPQCSKATVQEVMNIVVKDTNHPTTREAVRGFLKTVTKSSRQDEINQYSFLPRYLEELKKYNPLVTTDLVTTAENQMKRLFICPHESQQSFCHMRKIIAADGTHLRGRFIGTLLLAVGIDGNGKLLLLAWAVVESENTESWTWFFKHLRDCIPDTVGMTMFSNRDKGLIKAATEVYGTTIQHLYCCEHLKRKYTHFYSHLYLRLY